MSAALSDSRATAPGRRVGIYGGAFDPPHKAHVALAAAALRQLTLDELRVLPTGTPAHRSACLSPAEHRLAMAELAFGSLPRTRVDPRELLRTGPSFTIDTLRELRAEQPDAQWFLIVGEDQARAFPSWREASALAQAVTLCVARRPSAATPPIQPDPKKAGWQATIGAAGLNPACIELDLPPMPLSATEIRHALGGSHSVSALVPPSVARYIERHSLYQSP